MLDQAAVLERRRQILRVVLLVMIFATLPFYCLGFFLWASAPDRSPREVALPTATFTLIGGSGFVSNTPQPTLPLTFGTLPPLQPTPIQINPPVINPPVINPPTQIFIPSSTQAPTLTFAPLATDTPIPTSTSAPTLTTEPTLDLITEIPPDILPPPTDTPEP